MNIGNILSIALNRANLSVKDFDMRNVALDMLNEIIQKTWESEPWQWRQSLFYITTADGVEEYSLSKQSGGVNNILPNSMRGSTPIRLIEYKPSSEYYRTRPYNVGNATPYWFHEGEWRGIETDVSAASTVTIVSSQANTTTGTVAVAYGQNRVVFSASILTQNLIGQWFRVGTDPKRYQITSFDSATIGYLNAPYEGVTAGTASFAIGDIQQKALVLGYNTAGQLIEETVQLNGSTPVTTTNTFQGLLRISKSDRTYGYVTATSNGGVITNVILDPGETEADYQTVKFYPIPPQAEQITYEAYIKHPIMWRDTDVPLFPSQFHNLLVTELFIQLMTDWSKKEVSQITLKRRDEMIDRMRAINNSTDNWRVFQESQRDSQRSRINNLPNNYENEVYDYYS